MYAGKSKYTFFLTLFSIFSIVVKKCGQALRKSAGIQQISSPDALSSTCLPPDPASLLYRGEQRHGAYERRQSPKTRKLPRKRQKKKQAARKPVCRCVKKYNFSQKNLCKNRIAHPQNRYDTGQTKKKMSLLHLLQSKKNKDLPDGKPLFCVPLIPRGMRRS